MRIQFDQAEHAWVLKTSTDIKTIKLLQPQACFRGSPGLRNSRRELDFVKIPENTRQLPETLPESYPKITRTLPDNYPTRPHIKKQKIDFRIFF